MTPKRFLIVEDHDFQREALHRILLEFGAASVHTATNGADAIRLLGADAANIDIIITDLMLPEVDGIELLALLKKKAPAIPLILNSADPTALATAAAIATGVGLRILAAVVKPLTRVKLESILGVLRTESGEKLER